LFIALGLLLLAGPMQAASPTATLEQMFQGIPHDLASSGILYDRTLPLSGIEELDGGREAPAISAARLRQVLHELRVASAASSLLPAPEDLRANRGVEIPIPVIDLGYDRIREDAFEEGSARLANGRLELEPRALRGARVFAAAPLRGVSHQARVEFVIGPWTTDRERPTTLNFDPGDGRGLRPVSDDGRIVVTYASEGAKELRLIATWRDGSTMHAASRFAVAALVTPAPDDTLQVTASIAHDGSASSGEAYLYYAEGRTSLVQPVVLIEGFDLDDSMNWDEIYTLLNEENLIEDVRAAGYDFVVLNFDNATTEIQRNSYLVVELLQQVQQAIHPEARFSLAGASMGGLCSRFALAWMEQNGVDHRVNTFISFDAPQAGANIPLGLQYWLDFFSDQSADAAFLLSRLDTPAARQLLVYHHQTPASSTANADPLRGSFLSELAALGDYPSQPRIVSIANGSGNQAGQGFVPGAQIIEWEYDSLLVDIRGNVWAVGDGTSQQILEGLINPILLPSESLNVTVSGTRPFDNAPGGSRASMAQADSTEAPYGDIVALQPSHCFIPTVSALDLATSDLFYDIAGEPDLLSMTPFDAVYFPAENEGHVAITAQNAEWFKTELFANRTDTPPALARAARLAAIVPNPFNPRTTLHLEIFEAGRTRVDIFDLRGRRLTTLLDEDLEPGERSVVWDGKDASGSPVASGVYVARLEQGETVATRRMALVR
jgi:hypothetical protein